MNVEKTYPIGASIDGTYYQAVIGWSDTHQEYYARLETEAEEPDVYREYRPSIDGFDYSLTILLAHLQFEVSDSTGKADFVLSDEDIQALSAAPRQRLVDPSELIRIDVLDTDYAADPSEYVDPHSGYIFQRGRSAERQEIVPYQEFLNTIESDVTEERVSQAVYNSISELNFCTDVLLRLNRIELGLDDDWSQSIGTVQQRRETVIAQTARQITAMNDKLAMAMSSERRAAIASPSFEELLNIHTLLEPQEVDLIDTATEPLCGTKLTGFELAIARGYHPVTGLPLECRNSETYSWEAAVSDSAVDLYAAYGMSEEEAGRVVAIQRTDPQYRGTDDWAFLEGMYQRLSAMNEHNGSARA